MAGPALTGDIRTWSKLLTPDDTCRIPYLRHAEHNTQLTLPTALVRPWTWGPVTTLVVPRLCNGSLAPVPLLLTGGESLYVNSMPHLVQLPLTRSCTCEAAVVSLTYHRAYWKETWSDSHRAIGRLVAIKCINQARHINSNKVSATDTN